MKHQNAMAQYRSVQSRGAITDASPTRLIQLMLEHVLTQLSVAGAVQNNFAYDAVTGELKTVTDGAGQTTNYGYDARGNLTSVADPLKDTVGAIDDVVAMTDRVIEIQLRAPRPNMLNLLARPEFAIVRNGVGTGPFQIDPKQDKPAARIATPQERACAA